MFIKLTGANGMPVYVNVQQIVEFFKKIGTCDPGNTSIELPDKYLMVMETPEEVMELIAQNYRIIVDTDIIADTICQK